MSIELWAARLERRLTERETEAMLPLLPPERQERLLRIKQSEKRREPLCAYLILRHALWEQYRWRELPPIRLTSLGKPYFPDFPEVHFNLSHTTGAVLVALSGEPVGVDIEHIRPVSERAMRRLADVTTERAFFQSWVRREAGPSAAAPAWGPCWRRRPRSSLGSDSIFWTPFRAMWREWPPGTGARQARCANTPWMR